MPPQVQPGHFQLLYFASAASFTGRNSDQFTAPLPLKDLFGLLETRYPGMTKAVLSSCAITINLNYVDMSESNENNKKPMDSDFMTIENGDEVAIIPPVSSG